MNRRVLGVALIVAGAICAWALWPVDEREVVRARTMALVDAVNAGDEKKLKDLVDDSFESFEGLGKVAIVFGVKEMHRVEPKLRFVATVNVVRIGEDGVTANVDGSLRDGEREEKGTLRFRKSRGAWRLVAVKPDSQRPFSDGAGF